MLRETMRTRLLLVLLLAVPALPQMTVKVNRGGPIVIKTAQAEFEFTPAGYLRGYLLKDRARLTLDDPAATDTSDSIRADGQPLGPFTIDWRRVRTGSRRVEIPARSSGLARTTVLEILPEYPGMLLSTLTYKNTGATPLKLDEVVTQQHRLNASLTEGKARPYQLWSFHGSSSKWGLDDVLEITQSFSRPNLMGVALPNGYGGGVPLVAFWTGRAGMAIGHLETLPLALSIPVKVADDQHPRAALTLQPGLTLNPGETYSTPRTFLMVYSGDFYEPLRTYSLALQGRGWKLPKPSEEAYNISWCGWGYQFNVTPAQMLGVIPKLKEFGIKWTTLDDRWFDTYGDWNPRPDTFPGDSIKKMVEQYHRDGILAQIWWLPIGAEMRGPKYSSHAYIDSKVVQAHPDWLVLDKDGKPVIMVRQLATLCPALPEVQQYHKELTEKFIRDWGFDGHKLDNIYTVAPCYNPRHRHKSPYDSVNAMGEVYRVIFETTRALKPHSVTQSCPCGTPPSIAWLPYMDQAVTADPVGSAQVRRRVKMYKALLGPQAAVYGDHVELTEVTRRAGRKEDTGDDFASTVGLGAVIGTKFVWPQTDPVFRRVTLTPTKDQLWKKWIGIYHAKMLSRGEFLNLYTLGYDTPEGYAIRKDGKLYYAFFAAYPDETFKGEIELRGLAPGKYRVFDYVNDKELGAVDARSPRLPADFTGSLLLEVSLRP